ncbi:MAG TPA: PilZ domain-containing protein [Terriglobales bacterium]|nr:PilZ domain-containing protein [Terriglobales bacterium]
MARRREDRVKAELPVRVWGMTADGRPFNEHLKTRDVSRFGARIAWRNCSLKLGDIVGVQYQSEKGRFRIAWIAADKSEFGVASAEPGKSIWGPLPAGATTHPGRAASAEPAAVAVAKAPVARQHERRRFHRFPCQGGVQIQRPNSPPTWATLGDISAGGCYIETTTPLTMGLELDLTLKVADATIPCKGQVRTSHPGIGGGIYFTHVTPEARRQINQLLDVLAGIHAAEPAPPPQPSEPRTDITSRVYKSAEELRAIETLLQSDMADVDPRILTEFRHAVDHARETAWAVQTWVEMRKQRRDPFTLMPLVERRRIRQAVFLLKELLMDYQSSTITTGTDGFPDLQTAVDEFHAATHRP